MVSSKTNFERSINLPSQKTILGKNSSSPRASSSTSNRTHETSPVYRPTFASVHLKMASKRLLEEHRIPGSLKKNIWDLNVEN